MSKLPAAYAAYPPLVRAILDGLSDLKAENATVIDLRNLENAVCSFFVFRILCVLALPPLFPSSPLLCV